MRVFWRDLYGNNDESKIGIKEVSAPFKGVCNDCKKLCMVRHYPYSWLDNLGVLCQKCYERIDTELELINDENGISYWMD